MGHKILRSENVGAVKIFDVKVVGDNIVTLKEEHPLQLQNVPLSGSCTADSDCDDFDRCSVDKCENSMCTYDHDCKLCGLSKLVTVDVLTERYPDQTTWEVINYATNERVFFKNQPSYGINHTHSKSVCLEEGGYLFVINDSKLDGLCCGYDRGRYQVTIGGDRKILSGEFKSTKTHFFLVRDDALNASLITATPKEPSSSGLQPPQLHGVTNMAVPSS